MNDATQAPRIDRRRLLRGSLALGAALALSAAGTAPAAANGGADPAPNPDVAMLEQHFLMGMISHHREAVMMAEMAMMKSPQAKLRELAEAMIEEQTHEIEVMTHLLRDWYGMDAPTGAGMPRDMMDRMMPPMMHGMMPDMAGRMRALQAKSGAEFDIEFMSAMTDHHATAIMMAAPVLIAAHHEYLYTLAEQIVISQGEEIKQMDEWLGDWYGVPRAL